MIMIEINNTLLVLFEICRFLLLLVVLVVAAFEDFRCGEVSNWLWLYIPFGTALTVVQVVWFTPFLAVFVFPLMLVMGLLSVGLFYLSDVLKRVFRRGGFVFGGADSKVLLAVSLCFPLTASFSLLPYVNCVVLVFGLAGLLLLLHKGLRRNVVVRFVPYLAVGFLLAIIL